MIVAQRLEVKPVALDQEEPKVQLRLKPLYQVDTQDGAPSHLWKTPPSNWPYSMAQDNLELD